MGRRRQGREVGAGVRGVGGAADGELGESGVVGAVGRRFGGGSGGGRVEWG